MDAGCKVAATAHGRRAPAGGTTAREQMGGGPVRGRREGVGTWATNGE
jgi:hypothetical protein